MKKVLITGANSYIGKSLDKWLKKYPDQYYVESCSVRNNKWKNMNFSSFDVIFHAAGIAHVSTDPSMKDLYYKVNRDLTIEIAKKAKVDGVKQFIFMSSIIVYGNSNIISMDTIPNPTNFYGKSKLQAEEGIRALLDPNFKVAIVRSPMVYGNGSKGNYQKLSKFSRITPIFPDIDNKRSMIYIDNLCEFIRLIIKNEESGIFFPQNEDYVKTSEMVQLIAEAHGKKIKLIKIFNPFIRMFSSKVNFINKLFGDLVYEKSMSTYKENYVIIDFKESIFATESAINAREKI